MIDNAGGSSLGSALGSIVAKVVKPKPLSKALSKVVKPSSKSSSSSRGSSGRSSGGGGSSSGGGGGSNYSGGGGSASYTPPKAPSLSQYLGSDSVYQNTVSGSKRSLNDFLSDLTRRRGEAGTQFNQTTQSMDRDRTQQLDDLRQEFASRGLIQSGLYGQEEGKFQQKFTDQQNALQQQQTAMLADLLSQEKNYRRENDLSVQQAKQEALMRRAQKFSL